MNGHLVAADPRLIRAWLCARSVARGLPQPVPDHGGLRVETGSKEELRRFVFAAPVEGLRVLGNEIAEPRILIKLCAGPDALSTLLPPRWRVHASGYVMTRADGPQERAPIPAGFAIEATASGDRTFVRVVTRDGQLAASGYAVERDGVFVYDRIRTEKSFRGLGLGRALMTKLGQARRSPASQEVLVATEAGRRLYATLGWHVSTAYSTAEIIARFPGPPSFA